MRISNKTRLLRFAIISLIVLLGGGRFFHVAFAQEKTELSLRLSRDFGYSSGTGDMQGTFSMRVTASETLSRVEFYIDDAVIGVLEQAPYNLKFVTDNYSLGDHRLYAVGITMDGRELRSNEVHAKFVSASEGMQAAGKIIVPILVVTVVAMLISFGATLSSTRKLQHLAPGVPRKYGAAGGTICPRCHRPFSRHVLAPNMLVGKLERCPFCGKWSIRRAYSMDELRTAEQKELDDSAPGLTPTLDDEERLRQELEKSRFRDL